MWEDYERVKLTGLMNSLGLNGIGVEVGVHYGFFSDQLLLHSNLSLLVSVDLWSSEQVFVAAYRTLSKHAHRSAMLRCPSQEASRIFPDASLDFVYIDAAHDYWSVQNDIRCWWPKVKVGGLFSGHDYVPGFIDPLTNQFEEYGVIQAVNEFAAKHHQRISFVSGWPSWYCVKNERFISLL